MSSTRRLTMAQALVEFLANQHSERDGREQALFAGCFGIFGHGNVAGVGQALLEAEIHEPGSLPYYLGRNEQGMVHAAAGFARMRNRLSTLAVTTSVGPGDERQWKICDDPAHAWVRDSWPEQTVDPRLPLYGSAGRSS